jgi:hypothetical protein
LKSEFVRISPYSARALTVLYACKSVYNSALYGLRFVNHVYKNGGVYKQRQTAVPRVAGKAVVRVGEIPYVVCDNPKPEHIGPQHVFAAVALCFFAVSMLKPVKFF